MLNIDLIELFVLFRISCWKELLNCNKHFGPKKSEKSIEELTYFSRLAAQFHQHASSTVSPYDIRGIVCHQQDKQMAFRHCRRFSE